MKRTQCSYQYDTLERPYQDEELHRLKRQASALLETERQIWPEVGITGSKKVLDVGCGTGIVTRELGKQVYPAEVIGLDISKKLLEKCNDFTSAESRTQTDNVLFEQGSVYQLPFPDNSFDIIYARLLFQHLDRPMDAIQEVWRVLKPQGLLCILDVDRDWSSLYPEPQTSIDLDTEVVKKQRSEGGDPWVGRKLGYYLNANRFEQVRTRIELIDSDRIGLDKFFGMLSFGNPYQSKQSSFSDLGKKACSDVQELVESPYAWAGFGLFVVTGYKEG